MTRPLRLPAALIVLDGFSLGEDAAGNAVRAARTPNLDALFATCPHTTLAASGRAVGLPDGQMGNSEVGHLNIGAGRVVYQELTRVDVAIEDGSFFANQTLVDAIDGARERGAALHLMGLVSPGGVHSHTRHLEALVTLAQQRGLDRVWIHCFLDGRDTPPSSAAGYVAELETFLAVRGVGRIASVMGRYYAMDRDNRWDRVEKAWRCLVLGEGERAESADAIIASSYAAGVTDEFVVPARCADACVCDGDALVFFNFRPDRAREITRAFVDPGFAGFERPTAPDLDFVCLTEYDPTIPAKVAFPKVLPSNVLADVLADAGLRQLHIAETEKYAHVTFFLNGGVETPKAGEQRVLVPSPKVATYDLKPEMSAPEVTEKLVAAIESGAADVYLANYANCDMVGHTGVFEAAVRAVEAVDAGVGAVIGAIRSAGGVALVTADHGNAEHMVDSENDGPFTAHTLSDVPLIVVADGVAGVADDGKLADVAPTLVDLIGLAKPGEWTGSSLLIY